MEPSRHPSKATPPPPQPVANTVRAQSTKLRINVLFMISLLKIKGWGILAFVIHNRGCGSEGTCPSAMVLETAELYTTLKRNQTKPTVFLGNVRVSGRSSRSTVQESPILYVRLFRESFRNVEMREVFPDKKIEKSFAFYLFTRYTRTEERFFAGPAQKPGIIATSFTQGGWKRCSTFFTRFNKSNL